MIGEQQTMPLRTKPDHAEANKRRRGKIKPLGTIFQQQLLPALLARRFVQQRQIDAAPGHTHRRHNDLHRPAQIVMPKRRPQARMPLNKSLGRRPQNLAVQRTVKREPNLHRVDVGSLRIEQRMEQQPLLQRRQRQNVLNPRIVALQPLDLGLRQIDQRQIRRRAAASRRQCRMANQGLQGRKPAPRQFAHRRLIQQRRSPRPTGAQPRPVGPIQCQRIDLNPMPQRHPRIAAAPQRSRLRRDPPILTPTGRKPAQIVEAKLRRPIARKPRRRLRVQIAQQPIAKSIVLEPA